MMEIISHDFDENKRYRLFDYVVCEVKFNKNDAPTRYLMSDTRFKIVQLKRKLLEKYPDIEKDLNLLLDLQKDDTEEEQCRDNAD